MTLTQILAAFGPFVAALEPMLLNLEQSQLVPQLEALAEGLTTSPDLKLLLKSLADAVGSFGEAETQKLV